MIRIIFLVPNDLKLEELTEEQQQAISAVSGQWVYPVPNSLVVNGTVLLDVLVDDTFDVNKMRALGLDWDIVSMDSWDGTNYNVIKEPNTDLILERLRPIPIEFDNIGSISKTRAATMNDLHKRAGWYNG